MHRFNPFGGHYHLLQLMYGRTANFCLTALLEKYDAINRVGAMVVCLYIDCTNLNWCHQCSMHGFTPCGCHLQPVQLLYRRTSNFKGSVHICFRRAGSYGWTHVHQMYKSGLTSPMFNAQFQSIWWPFPFCTVDVRMYSQFFLSALL